MELVLDFGFSGKDLMNLVNTIKQRGELDIPDIATSFQESAVKHLEKL